MRRRVSGLLARPKPSHSRPFPLRQHLRALARLGSDTANAPQEIPQRLVMTGFSVFSNERQQAAPVFIKRLSLFL